MTLSKKIYFTIKCQGKLNTNNVIVLLKKEFNNTIGSIAQSEEWYIIFKRDLESGKNEETIKALWQIVNTGYAKTELIEENKKYTWTTYNGKKRYKKENFNTKVRYWEIIKEV